MHKISFDLTSRLLPLMEHDISEKAPENYTYTRVGKAILPLIVLIPQAARFLQLTGGFAYSYSALTEFGKHREYTNLFTLTINVASTALTLAHPFSITITQNALDAAKKVNTLATNIFNKEYKSALFQAFLAAEKCIYIHSIITNNPLLTTTALITKIVLDIYMFKKLQEKKMFLESFVQIASSAARFYGLSYGKYSLLL